MSLSRRSSMSPPQPAESTRELKHRVITCLNKLSDRDTLAVASTELDFIARNLTHELYSPFLTCIHTTDSSEKSPVRKQCVRVLELLSETHGDALSPHLSKMISTVVRRLRDPDSSIRSACINAVTAMSLQITKPPFSTFLKSFMDVISTEQDYNAQIGSSLCLAAAIEAAPDPEPALLSKVLPRLLKLVKSECFKAKPALLSLIGSVVSAGGASSRGALDYLVPSMIEFLSSEDWAARKAAAEVLGKVAALDRVLVAEYTKTCLGSLESRRFDKVKVVRDTMNSTLELWKNVSDVLEDVLPPSQSKSSSRDSGNEGCFPSVFKNYQDVASETIQSKKATPISRSPPSNNSLLTSTTKKRSPLKTNDRISYTAMSRKLDYNPDWKTEVAIPHSSAVVSENNLKSESKVFESAENDNMWASKLETERVLFSKICAEKLHKFGHVKSGSRVVPISERENSELDAVGSNATDEVYGDHKDIEDLNLIRTQLVQIENQQSNLLDVLQRFIGSSRNGMNSLETRVQGLEMAINEISYDLALSNGSISNTDSTGNTCCKLPGTEFLSPKFWRRTEGRYSTPKFSSSGGIISLNPICNMSDKGARAEIDNQRVQEQNGSSAAIYIDRRRNLEFSNRTVKNMNQSTEREYVQYAGELDGSSNGSCGTSLKLGNRLST